MVEVWCGYLVLVDAEDFLLFPPITLPCFAELIERRLWLRDRASIKNSMSYAGLQIEIKRSPNFNGSFFDLIKCS